MIQILAMNRLRQHAKAALTEQAYVDQHGVLGVPTRAEGCGWDANWDVTAVLDLIDCAVVLNWKNGDLEVKGRYGTPRHFRLHRPGDMSDQASADDLDVQAYGPNVNVWEVTAPDGHVVVHGGIELADYVYRTIAPAGSHLHRAAPEGVAA
jgi:hypothetical protein